MKKSCLWIVCCVFALTACGQKNEGELLTEETLKEDRNEQETCSEENGYWQEKDSSSEKVLDFVTGMKIVLPDEWVGNVDVSVWPSLEDYGGKLAISEKRNLEAGASGDLLYLDYVNKKIAEDKPYQIFATETVLGVYKPDEETEYALILELPREMTWVEGDENMKEIYDQFSAQIEELQIITEDMPGFIECGMSDVQWIESFVESTVDEGEISVTNESDTISTGGEEGNIKTFDIATSDGSKSSMGTSFSETLPEQSTDALAAEKQVVINQLKKQAEDNAEKDRYNIIEALGDAESDERWSAANQFIKDRYPDYFSSKELLQSSIEYGHYLASLYENYEGQNNGWGRYYEMGKLVSEAAQNVYLGTNKSGDEMVVENMQKLEEQLKFFYDKYYGKLSAENQSGAAG